MELKEYQAAALDSFARWLTALNDARVRSAKRIATLQSEGHDINDEDRNYPKAAWKTLSDAGDVANPAAPYIPRTDGADRPIPHICFKVPTGGGKTLLAATALERLNRQTGLTLWLIPTRAIYQQTKAALYNREHPYRQALERASGGRVKMLQKDDPFTAADIANYLCVMLLMLPAANRQKGRDFLRMFRDSGRYPTLFPDADDALADARMLNDHPDLERESQNGPVKHSLFNAIKTLRPVIILDEAHKAYGKQRKGQQEFAQSVSRLNPRMVIELSATPNKGVSNLLVDIDGIALKNEEVIKLPVQITSFPNTGWHGTLHEAHDKLKELADEAQSLQHDENRYIRPIAIVRVERTGKDQRDGERIHSEDVREYLTQILAVPADAVAVRSSELDELRGVDLLSEFTPIRWIITKSALMEGWDCPFAYLLVMLDNTRAQTAITQLVGRIMRQPDVRRTDREPLDQCYVYCSSADVDAAIKQVKNGLEQEGLTGLGDMVFSNAPDAQPLTVHRRKKFQGADIFLPLVLHKAAHAGPDADQWEELDYQRHILPAIDWHAVSAPDPQATHPNPAIAQFASVDVDDAQPRIYADRELHIDKTPRVEWFARRLSDLIPNPWHAARIAQDLLQKCRAAGETDSQIYDRRSFLAHALREHVANRIDAQAETAFKSKLAQAQIRFDLQTGKPNYQMVDQYEISASPDAGLMTSANLQPMQLALFQPLLSEQFDSDLERRFARYLDEQKALRWWHKVAARQSGHYYLRGWKPDRIWPDFIAMGGETDGIPHVLVFETKGAHLSGNPDTEYKKRVLETLENAYNSAGAMKICEGPARGTFRLIFSHHEFDGALRNLNAAPAYNA